VPSSPDSARNGRSMYLLDGRRVTLLDLIEAGLLGPDSRLRFGRPRIGTVHYAVVTANGGVVIDDGQEFRSPSRAAAIAADMRTVDGWHAWVDESGRSLDSLRSELLDAVAREAITEETAGDEALAIPQRRHEYLKDARARADEGKSVETTVRELLSLWGARVRSHRISQRIDADLANHGLATSPSFRKVTLDATVVLVGESEELQEKPPVELPDADGGDELDIGLTVGNLTSALAGIAAVVPTATFDEVITRMLLDDYSQLAVLSGRHLKGAVTWRSIAKARHVHYSASFSDAIVPAHEVPYYQELIDILPRLEAEDFVFVRDEKNLISGIVTTADVVHAYGEMATPFFLIGELDLRRVASALCPAR